jgi:hypothetical protein
LVAIGILPVILGRLASRPYSLSHHFGSRSDQYRLSHKAFRNSMCFCASRIRPARRPVATGCGETPLGATSGLYRLLVAPGVSAGRSQSFFLENVFRKTFPIGSSALVRSSLLRLAPHPVAGPVNSAGPPALAGLLQLSSSPPN